MKESSAAIHVQVPVDVATFLLNEKRNDIHRIESRLKVSITLIPNPHMETPHYSVNRLRQDDITSEHLQASYKLVEKPEETKTVAASSAQEVKAQRPQAAVKGITPAQPAPKHEERKAAPAAASPSFFGKLFGWLFGSSEASKPAEPAKTARPQNPRRERDSNRGERAEGGNRQRNKPRRDREEGNATSDVPLQNKGPAKEPRGERPPRQPRPANTEKPVLETAKPVIANEQNAEEGSGNTGRKRGRRGGRREREKREQQNNSGESMSGDVMTTASELATQHSVIATPELPVATPVQPVAETEVVAAEIKAEQTAVAIVEPAVVAPASTPAVVVPSKVEDLAPVLHEAGLVMIETDQNKAAAIIVPQENISHAPRRRNRPREVYTAENNEPLVMIETQQSK